VILQHAFEHALVDGGGIQGLVLLVVVPGIPTEHPGQCQHHTGQYRRTMALPDVLDAFNLFFFRLVTHPALLSTAFLARQLLFVVIYNRLARCCGTSDQARFSCSPSSRSGLSPTLPAAASASPRISAYRAPDLSAFLNWLLKLPPPQCTTRR